MDRRLSLLMDSKYNDGKTIFIRNAGASVYTAFNSIKQAINEEKIKSIIIAVHTDCGAMGYVHDVLSGKAIPPASISSALVSHFQDEKFASREEIEKKINPMLQENAISKLAMQHNIEVHTEIIETEKIELPEKEGRHALIITLPSSAKYSELIKGLGIGIFDAYFIQAFNIEDMLPDVEMAVSVLGIKDVHLVCESQEQRQSLESFKLLLKRQGFMQNASLSMHC